MSVPRVTWLLPVLNCRRFLDETLASLAAQTVTDHEVILWDNGSSDGSLEIARSWIPTRLPGIIISDRPLPLHACLAAMVELARSEFCARIDADDVCEPPRLAVQLDAFLQRPDLLALGSQIAPIDEEGRPTTLHYPLPETYSEILDRLLETNCVSHPTVMFRRGAVLAVGNYRRPAPVEDYDLWLRLASAGVIANSPARLIKYRLRSTSVTHQALKAKTLSASLDEAWNGNAVIFAGLAHRSEAARLRQRKVHFALPQLWKIARTFSRRDGIAPLGRFHRVTFQQACRPHVARHDLLTRTLLKLAAPRSPSNSP